MAKAASKSKSPKAKATPSAKKGDRFKAQRATLATILGSLAVPTADQIAAFRGYFSDARCDAIGTETRAAGVVIDATAFASAIAKGLAAHGSAIRYSKARLAYFCGLIEAVADAVEAQETAHGSTGGASATLQRALEKATAARTDLHESLEAAVGDDDADEAAALATAFGGTGNAEEVVTSLSAMATLGEAWLGRRGAFATRVHEAGVTQGEIDAARAAAEVLSAASTGKTLAGRADVRDAPATNRAEGRVVLEMGAAMRAFARAARKNKLIAKLVPGKATRHALVRREPKPKGASGGGGASAGNSNGNPTPTSGN